MSKQNRFEPPSSVAEDLQRLALAELFKNAIEHIQNTSSEWGSAPMDETGDMAWFIVQTLKPGAQVMAKRSLASKNHRLASSENALVRSIHSNGVSCVTKSLPEQFSSEMELAEKWGTVPHFMESIFTPLSPISISYLGRAAQYSPVVVSVENVTQAWATGKVSTTLITEADRSRFDTAWVFRTYAASGSTASLMARESGSGKVLKPAGKMIYSPERYSVQSAREILFASDGQRPLSPIYWSRKEGHTQPWIKELYSEPSRFSILRDAWATTYSSEKFLYLLENHCKGEKETLIGGLALPSHSKTGVMLNLQFVRLILSVEEFFLETVLDLSAQDELTSHMWMGGLGTFFLLLARWAITAPERQLN